MQCMYYCSCGGTGLATGRFLVRGLISDVCKQIRSSRKWEALVLTGQRAPMKQEIILLYDFMRVAGEIIPCISNQELLNEHTIRLLIQRFTYQCTQCNPCD